MSSQSDIQRFVQGISRPEYVTAAALGLIPGVSVNVKFGYAPSIAALGDVWPQGTPYVFPVAAGQAVEAVSDNAADTHTLLIEGIDAVTKEARTEEVTLTGIVAVAVPGTWLAINRAYNSNTTAYLGEIQVRGTGAPNANVFAVVLAADQQTTQCPVMIPDNKIAVVNNVSTALNKSGGVDVATIMRLVVTREGKVPRTQIRYGLQRSGTSNLSSDLIVPILVAPLARVRVTAEPSGAADISAEYSMLLIDKDLVPAAVLASLL